MSTAIELGRSSADRATIDLGRRRWLVLGVMALASAMVMVSNTVLNTALPAMARDLEAGTSTLLWIVNGYTLILAGLLLAAGTAGDRFGRRRFLALGLLIFGAGSAGAALSSDANLLIGMRGVQGAGAALIFPATLSIITNVFARRERALAIGIWAASTGLGIAVGPLVGGALVDEFSWPAVFWMLVPACGALLVGLLVVPDSRDRRRRRLDVPGAVLATLGLLALVYGIIEGESAGWTSAEILIAFAAGVGFLVAFIAAEARSNDPMLPLHFFRQRDFNGGVFTIFFVAFALMVVLFFLVLFLQVVQGKSAFAAGLQMLPMAGMMIVGAPISGLLVGKVGPKLLIVLAMVVMFAGVVWLTRLDVDSSYLDVVIGLLAFGFGGGMAMAPMTDTVMAAVPVDDAGIGSAINDVMRELGAALGIAVTGTVVASLYATQVTADLTGVVPPEIVASVADGIALAAVVAQQLKPGLGLSVQDAAGAAFVDAFTTGFWISAGFMAAAAILAIFLIPLRMRTTQATALDPTAPLPVGARYAPQKRAQLDPAPARAPVPAPAIGGAD